MRWGEVMTSNRVCPTCRGDGGFRKWCSGCGGSGQVQSEANGFLDLPEDQQGELLSKATEAANKEQRKMMSEAKGTELLQLADELTAKASEAKCGTCKHTWASHGYRSCTGNRNLCQCKADVPNATWDGTKWVGTGTAKATSEEAANRIELAQPNDTTKEEDYPTGRTLAHERGRVNNTDTFEEEMWNLILDLKPAHLYGQREPLLAAIMAAHREQLIREYELIEAAAAKGESRRKFVLARIEELKERYWGVKTIRACVACGNELEREQVLRPGTRILQ